ncbi:MAG: ABC transporter permease [archaeon]|nr:ABC transporter permease [archaeon]
MSTGILKSLSDNRLVISAMVERNLKGRYRNSAIGIAWNILMPVLLIFAVWLVFTQVKTHRSEADFWLYLSIGIFTMSTCSNCIRGRVFFNNSNYVKKIAIPRWVEVLSDTIAQFITLGISYVLLLAVALIGGHHLDLTVIVFLPVSFVLLFVTCLGFSLLFSTVNVVNNDIGHLMVVVSRIVVWLTPVFFFMNEAEGLLKTVATCNPFTYIVEVLHQTIYWGEIPDIGYLGMAALIAFIAFAFGWIVFSHFEKNLAEML